MDNILAEVLRKLKPAGLDGFEGLIANLLETLTDQHFHLAKAGSQSGRDMSSRLSYTSVIAVECKRYGSKTELNERELQGELVEARDTILDLDLWVLVTSREVGSVLHEKLSKEANDHGIEFLTISIGDGELSSLEVLCTLASSYVLAFVKKFISVDEEFKLHQQFKYIATHPDFEKQVNALRAKFSPANVGYDAWRVKQNLWLISRFQSEADSRATFGQPLNVVDAHSRLIDRQIAWQQLDNWLSQWHNTKNRLAILGEEGDGKTWSIASWLARRIEADPEFPPVVFLSSKDGESNDPIALISNIITNQLRIIDQVYWSKRLNRWMQRPKGDSPVLLLVLDGINERRKFEWWRTLLDKLAGSPFANEIAILITCRTAYWERYVQPLRHLSATIYKLPAYDDEELDKALGFYELKRTDIPSNLLPLIRKPRYFDLMVKYRERMSESGDITVARLIYEDWRDRLDRKQHLGMDNDTFMDVIRGLASKNQNRASYLKGQDVESLLPSLADKEEIFEELRTGGILQGKGNKYQVNEQLLIYGFGLLLVDQVEQSSLTDQENLAEVIAEWLEPQDEVDIKARICEFAALHALELPSLHLNMKIALLHAWINNHNLSPETEDSFSAYFPRHPETYIRLAELTWSNANDNSWAQELIMQTFRYWGKSLKFITIFQSAFEYWLGFVNLYGSPLQLGPKPEDLENLKAKINERLGYELQTGTFLFAGHTLTAIDDDGLLRLGRMALAIISELPRSSFIHAIATGCVAEAIMGEAVKNELFAWIFHTSPVKVWTELQVEITQLLRQDNLIAKQVAYRLLSFEGNEEAYKIQQTLPRDLFPRIPWIEELRKDPCSAGFSWSQADCETCLHRRDLETQLLARQSKSHYVNPDLTTPEDWSSQLEFLIQDLPTDTLWSNLMATSEDLSLELYEPSLARCTPYAFAHLVQRIVQQMRIRNESSLYRISYELIKHHLIFTHEEQEAIYNTWLDLHKNQNIWEESQETTEMWLFKLVLGPLTAERQLALLTARSEKALDLLAYEDKFLPFENYEFLCEQLIKASTTKVVQRILWFLSANPKSIPSHILQENILPFLNQEDSATRALTLEILYGSQNLPAIQMFLANGWAWSGNHHEHENHWGSLLLCEYGIDRSFDEIFRRVYPIYLGYAIKYRQYKPSEIIEYAKQIHKIWHHIGKETPDLPEDFPDLEVSINETQGRDILSKYYINLSDNLVPKPMTFLNRSSSWGGMSETEMDEWWTDSSEAREKKAEILRNVVKEAIYQQRQAGNLWFARSFYPHALEEVLTLCPDQGRQWLDDALSDQSESLRRLHLSSSFYEALCIAFLKKEPDSGVDLYWRLKQANVVLTQNSHSKIFFLDYAFWGTLNTSKVLAAWQQKLEKCRTDKEMMDIAILAQSGSGQEWLWSYIEQRVKSSSPLEMARSFTILGFIDSIEARSLLQVLIEQQPDTWKKRLATLSLTRWQTNHWSKHWFRQFLSAADNILAWAAFRLFLRSVDNHFWHWQKEIIAQEFSDTNPYWQKRLSFLQDNFDIIRNSVRKSEEQLEKTFLGQKIMDKQVWPWL